MSTLTLTKSYKKHQSWSQEYPPLAARKTVSKFKKYQPKIQSSSPFLCKRPDWKATKFRHQNGVLDHLRILVDASLNSFSLGR